MNQHFIKCLFKILELNLQKKDMCFFKNKLKDMKRNSKFMIII